MHSMVLTAELLEEEKYIQDCSMSQLQLERKTMNKMLTSALSVLMAAKSETSKRFYFLVVLVA